MSDDNDNDAVDALYPGTAVARLRAVHARVAEAAAASSFDGPWCSVRRRLLWAGGLRDLPDAAPGAGCTAHGFNDYNHVDLTTMNDETTFNENAASGANRVAQIAVGNRLGAGIRIASLPELGPGGSWTTCANGCDTGRDVAHVQFRSRIAFKLVWEPGTDYTTFVLVDDEGGLLARGRPTDSAEARLPGLEQRRANFRLVAGSKYAAAVSTK